MSAALMLAAAILATKGLDVGPTGFYRFCLSHSEECQAAPGLPLASKSLLIAINDDVNKRISPQNEGSADVWALNPSRGDCEDYAITKRSMLIKAGVSSSALRIAVGTLRSGERHAVLIATTDSGELVLDNLTGDLTPVDRADIRFESIQSPSAPRIWLKIH